MSRVICPNQPSVLSIDEFKRRRVVFFLLVTAFWSYGTHSFDTVNLCTWYGSWGIASYDLVGNLCVLGTFVDRSSWSVNYTNSYPLYLSVLLIKWKKTNHKRVHFPSLSSYAYMFAFFTHQTEHESNEAEIEKKRNISQSSLHVLTPPSLSMSMIPYCNGYYSVSQTEV